MPFRIRRKFARSLLVLGLGAGLVAAAGCQRTSKVESPMRAAARHPSKKTLAPFASEAELREFLEGKAKAARATPATSAPGSYGYAGEAEASAPAQAAQPSAAPTEAKASESVTNTQHAGVDEGGIVKNHGDHLVILRRGRLFTVDVSGSELTPISNLDAFGPDIDPEGTWYDEMLIGGNTIVVVGYSYSRGGTELGLFDIDAAGRLKYRATYHLRSNDYYSSRNYASRLVGDKLIFYSPLYLAFDEEDPLRSFPALRKWRKGAKDSTFAASPRRPASIGRSKIRAPWLCTPSRCVTSLVASSSARRAASSARQATSSTYPRVRSTCGPRTTRCGRGARSRAPSSTACPSMAPDPRPSARWGARWTSSRSSKTRKGT
ncbi:MAG: beta-propeller domain-containing protein [Polyangiaceae bacterium]